MIDKKKLMSDLEGLTFDDWHMYHCDTDVQGIAIDALELLKEQEHKITELEHCLAVAEDDLRYYTNGNE